MQNINKSIYKINNLINRYYSNSNVNKVIPTTTTNTTINKNNIIKPITNYKRSKQIIKINELQDEGEGEEESRVTIIKKPFNNKHIMERDPQDRSLSQKQYFEKLGERGDVDKMLNLIKHMPERRTVYAYEKLILACSVAGRFNQSWTLYNSMKKDGLKPSIYIFGTMINSCTTATGIDASTIESRITRIIGELEKYETKVSVNFFNIIMKTLIVIGKYDHAITFIDKMKNEAEIKPDITTYTTWITAISEKFKQDNSFDTDQKEFLTTIRTSKNSQLLDQLRTEGNKQIDVYMNIVKQVKNSQIKPDRYFVNTILNACKNTKNPEGVLQVWSTIQEMRFLQSLNADTKTYDILISTCNNINQIDRSLEFFNEIFFKSIRPDIHLINNCFRICLRIASIKSEKKRDTYQLDELINRVMDYMAAYNLYPNDESFSILISTYSKLNQHSKVYELLLEMKELGIEPNIKHYSGIISSFSNDIPKCLELFKVLISQNIKVTPDFIVHMQNIISHTKNDKDVEVFTNLLREHDLKK